MTVTEKLNGYGPLAGIKVVEMCTYVAAPATVRVLSEMGAEVIKIESFAGDTQRTQGPGFGCELTDTEDPTIDLNNTNKNWVSLNLKDPEGLAIAKKMIGEADIFMNNMRTAALKKLGLDYETLHEEFPGLIWGQMRGYGEFGEFAHAPGYDAVCWAARGGVAGTFPEKDTSPAIPPQAFGDYNTAIMMAAGLLGALVNKLRTGQGDKVVVNLYHSAIWGGSIGLCAQQFGADYPKSRTDVPNPFNNTYKTADDKWLYICQPQHNRYYNDMMKTHRPRRLGGRSALRDHREREGEPPAAGAHHHPGRGLLEEGSGGVAEDPGRVGRAESEGLPLHRHPEGRRGLRQRRHPQGEVQRLRRACAAHHAHPLRRLRRPADHPLQAHRLPHRRVPGALRLHARADRRAGGEGRREVLPRRGGAGCDLQVRAPGEGRGPLQAG